MDADPKCLQRALFCINTPAQAHTWRFVIDDLMRNGHQVEILARDYGSTPELLKGFGFGFSSFKPISQKSLRIFEIIPHLSNGWRIGRGFGPSIVIGFGVDAALTAALIRKPCIVFTDSEPVPLQHLLEEMFSSVIITPNCFTRDLGKKHIFIQGYKESAYLHPNYFKPDPSVWKDLNLNSGEKYILIRLNVFDAVHDIGKWGFTRDDQFRLVDELGKYARVFISPEGNLPPELEKYRLPAPQDRIHSVLYHAHLLVSDTQTMTTEAAFLGTPAVRCNSFCGAGDMGNFIELEKKYGLIYSFRKTAPAILKALELICRPNLKEEWAEKRQKLLRDQIDVTRFMVDFVENFPESFKTYKEKWSKT
jgi:uncharacterized protein